MITELNIVPGQSVGRDEVLLRVRITDEELIAAQTDLLKKLARLEVLQKEIDRQSPLVDKQIISAKGQRKLIYEAEQLEKEKNQRIAELGLRGLAPDEINNILQEKQFARVIDLRVEHEAPSDEQNHSLTVTDVNTTIGESVKRGDTLCHLAEHAKLLIRGEAFETDISAVNRLKEEQWGVTAEFGHSHVSASHVETIDNLQVLYTASHVDEDQQTYHFYLPIANEVIGESKNESGAVFRTWRFKPGQRVHLRVPVEKWPDQLVVPVQAVVNEGANMFVYRHHQHSTESSHTAHEGHAHRQDASNAPASTGINAGHPEEKHQHSHFADGEHHAHAPTPQPAPPKNDGHEHSHADDQDSHAVHPPAFFAEFTPVPVHVLYRDDRFAVIDKTGNLRPGDEIALNNAYQLHLAMKLQGDTGDSHGHEHN